MKDKTSAILAKLTSAYNQADDDFAWDDVDWDTVFVDLQELAKDKVNTRRLFDEYIVINEVPKKLFAIILAGQMMNPVEESEEEFAASLIKELSDISLKEAREDYLDAIATSLGCAYMKEAKEALLRLSTHPSKQVRLSATVSLHSQDEDDPEVRPRLEELATDDDPEVREWALFALEVEASGLENEG